MTRSIPVATYHQTSDLATSQVWDTGPKALSDFLANRPMYRGHATFAVLFSSGVWTPVNYNLTDIDTDGAHNNIVNNTRFTAQVAGWYWVKGSSAWNPTGVGNNASRFDTAIAKNATIVAGSATFVNKQTNDNACATASTMVQLAVGDYLELYVRQLTGTSIFIDNNSFGTLCDFNVIWISS